MIRLIPNPTFKSTVRFTQPGAEDALVNIEFRHKSPAAFDAWWSGAKEKPIADGMAEVIVGWSGVIDEVGAEVPFSVDALALFLGGHAPRGRELLGAYMRELLESRQKN
jgi:hypothetical protein